MLSNLVGASTFTITEAKFCVPIVTLSTENNEKLSKLLSERFKRSVCWNKKNLIPNDMFDKNDYIRELLDVNYQGAKRLCVLVFCFLFVCSAVSDRRYFHPRVNVEN